MKIRIHLSKKIYCFLGFIGAFFISNIRSKADSDSDLSLRYGIHTKQFLFPCTLKYNYGAFVEYDFNKYLGLQVGVEYANNVFLVAKKGLWDFIKDLNNADKFNNLINNIEGYIADKKDEISNHVFPHNVNYKKEYNDEKIKIKNFVFDKLEESELKELGIYSVDYIAIPLLCRVRPFGGNFAINLGLEFGILLSAKYVSTSSLTNKFDNLIDTTVLPALEQISEKYKSQTNVEEADVRYEVEQAVRTKLSRVEVKKLFSKYENGVQFKGKGIYKIIREAKELLEEIDKNNDKIGDKPLLNKLQVSGIVGFDHTFCFGLILGLSYTHVFKSFVNTSSEGYKPIGDCNLQLRIGIDIAQLINIIQS